MYMDAPNDITTPSRHEHNGNSWNIWPNVERTVTELSEYNTDLPDEETDLGKYEIDRFHDKQEIEVEYELLGWDVYTETEWRSLSVEDYPTRESVIEAIVELIES